MAEVETKKPQEGEAAEEAAPKVALTSAKGIIFVCVLLAIEGILLLGAHFFLTRSGASDSGRPRSCSPPGIARSPEPVCGSPVPSSQDL